MMGLGRAAGIVAATLGLGAGIVFGAPYAREAGYLPEAETTTVAPNGLALAQQTPFTRHTERYFEPENAASHVNALCGYSNTLAAGEVFLTLGTSETPSLRILKASDEGDLYAYQSFSASADALSAYEEFGELVIQTDGERFSARSFVVETDGEYGASFPLENKRYHRLACDNAEAAASALNALFSANGADTNAVKNKVRSFAVTSIWDVGDTIVELVDACTPTEAYQDLPIGRPVLIDARYKSDGAYGNVYHDMSGEYLEGVPTEVLNLTIAERFEGDTANVLTYSAPIDWSDLPTTDNGFGPSYRFAAVHVYAFSVEPDGSQSHSEDMGGVPYVDIPCADVEAGRGILEAMRNGTFRSPEGDSFG